MNKFPFSFPLFIDGNYLGILLGNVFFFLHVLFLSIIVQGEDPFSVRNLLTLGLKLVLAVVGGNAGGIDKSDNSPVQVVIQVNRVFPP